MTDFNTIEARLLEIRAMVNETLHDLRLARGRSGNRTLTEYLASDTGGDAIVSDDGSDAWVRWTRG